MPRGPAMPPGLQVSRDHPVIVPGPRIAGNHAVSACLEVVQGVGVRTIVPGDGDDVPGAGQQGPRIGALCQASGQPCHVSVVAGLDEAPQILAPARIACRTGDAACGKPEIPRLLLQTAGKRHRHNGSLRRLSATSPSSRGNARCPGRTPIRCGCAEIQRTRSEVRVGIVIVRRHAGEAVVKDRPE